MKQQEKVNISIWLAIFCFLESGLYHNELYFSSTFSGHFKHLLQPLISYHITIHYFLETHIKFCSFSV